MYSQLICLFVVTFSSHVSTKGVLIILGDDVGFESGVYGNTVCKTPHIDSLARRSLVFDRAYTSVSSCSPSRSALLTGLPQHQNGMYGLENSYHHFHSFDTVRSLPNILAERDVYTGIIGKKHVAPESVYSFNYSMTEMDHKSVNQVGRNITYIKELVREFLRKAAGRDFILYVAFHDAHRCGHTTPQLGVFCEKFGDSSIAGMGNIPDWTPSYYTPDEVVVPYFIPDTPAARVDIAAQYKTISRFDQGIGLVLKEFVSAGVLDHTLVMMSSDNGIPFPSGRTNLYEPGMREPFMISHPSDKSAWGKRSDALVNLLDVMPTVLDWFNIGYPHYSIFHGQPEVELTGRSLLPLLSNSVGDDFDVTYASQSLHEITMYYPMRVVCFASFKLIHNLNYLMPFPIDQDFYVSPTFRDMMNRTAGSRPLNWYKTLDNYYYRPQYELFDLSKDPVEVNNLHNNLEYRPVMLKLMEKLKTWQAKTADPWICAPTGVFEDISQSASGPRCMPLYNGVPTPDIS